MKNPYLVLLPALLTLAQATSAQDPVSSGEIRYEVTRRIDFSQMRVNINGQEMRPGATLPNGQTLDLPQTTEYGQSLLFAGNLAFEKRDMPAGMMRTVRMGGPEGRPDGPPPAGGDRTPDGRPMRERRFNPPVENQVYIDLSAQTIITVLGIKKDSLTTEYYRSDSPIVRDSTWQEDDKTRRIAGYKCHRATANLKNTPYTIWYTTELPFTYSPVPSLTPDKGVVLQIESDQEAFKATKVEAKAVDEATLRPNPKAQLVSRKQLDEIRRKAMASFRQRMMAENPMRN